ncbi:MAG TPA: MBL fold metallo-hydrolase [Bryobacteraceae bacterium]|nr:MBL fold metallo-hydrolase [Bryobacteraceae bacterium]
MLILEILALLAALIFIALGILLAPALIGLRPLPDRLEINGLRILKDRYVSVCVLPLGGGGVALFDAGADKSGKTILDELARLGLGPEAVTAVLLTHGHHDHVAAAGLFPNARIMSLAEEVEIAEGLRSPGGPFMLVMRVAPAGFKVHRALRDGETVELGGTKVRVFAVPGHTPGSAAFLVNGVLILGDAAGGQTDGRLRTAPWVFNANSAQNRASLKQLAARLSPEGSVQALVFGHSGAMQNGIEPLTALVRNW